jgi:heme exporter protein D
MIWSSPSAFFAMGGYALYVWGAYAVCLALMLAEPWLARRQRAQALRAAGQAIHEGQDT